MTKSSQQPDRTPATAVLENGAVVLSIDEAAAVLRVNRKTVVAMIERRQLPSVRYARKRWVPAQALRELLCLDQRPLESSITVTRV